ncbi:phospholipid carrier-dependent glycosyltransferase [Rubrobacter taiwanensis]|uniref:Phospholipid carrier-dependent glycosyltransferase n=1 Tax=Rubrobacter taiwanensis TaxID=185139 RepID=A0A4R1BHJ8_9ACTN|nr:glycosyltransferase family 39 protein [Rubrobacter taiwanensis]TCJ16765.1 phospholipid carrier-dependent glycosyltransferase [Rubrobacter taiwanensis]
MRVITDIRGSGPNLRVLVLLCLIVILGSALRFYGLDRESLWTDELATWHTGSRESVSEVLSVVYDGGEGSHPPGYYVFMHFWQQLFGDSEWVLRFPAALAGVLTIPAVFLLGRRLYSDREGLIAAALTAVMWAPVYYSQEARMYSPLILFAVLTALFWLEVRRGLEEGRFPRGAAAGYALSAAVAAYLHYFGLYLVAMQGIWMLLLFAFRGRALLRVFALYGSVVLLYLPWARQTAERLLFGSNQPIAWLDRPDAGRPLEFLEFLFGRSEMIATAVLALLGFLLLRALYDGARGFAGGEGADVRGFLASPGVLLALWLAVPFAGAYVLSLLGDPVLLFRTLLISAPAAYLLTARALARLPLPAGAQAAATAAAAALLVLHLVFSMDYYSEPDKHQYREAVAYMAGNTPVPEETVVVGCGYRLDYLEYYFRREGLPLKFAHRACSGEHLPGAMEAISERNPRCVWYVRAHMRPNWRVIGSLAKEFELERVHRKKFKGVEVWIFRSERLPGDLAGERGSPGKPG